MNYTIDSFESERLLLEVRKEHHAAEVFELFSEPELYTYIMRVPPPSVEWLADGFKRLERLLSLDGKEIMLGWIAKEKSTRLPIGGFEITIIKNIAFIAYTVFKPYWRRGFAVEGSQAMMNYILETYPVKRFVIEMDTRNRASVKVAEKLDFEFIKVKDNACFLKGLVSHEFLFQKEI